MAGNFIAHTLATAVLAWKSAVLEKGLAYDWPHTAGKVPRNTLQSGRSSKLEPIRKPVVVCQHGQRVAISNLPGNTGPGVTSRLSSGLPSWFPAFWLWHWLSGSSPTWPAPFRIGTFPTASASWIANTRLPSANISSPTILMTRSSTPSWWALPTRALSRCSALFWPTALGIFIGVCRLSANWIVAKLATVYIEFFRNVPLLVQLFFWFYIVLALPGVRESYVIFDWFYLSNRGFSMPWPHTANFTTSFIWMGLALLAIVVGVLIYRRQARREEETGRPSYPLIYGTCATVAIGAVTWLLLSFVSGASPFFLSAPEPQGRFGNIVGGFTARAGVDGPAGWVGDVHRQLHCRDSSGRNPVGRPRPNRSFARLGPVTNEHPEECNFPPRPCG